MDTILSSLNALVEKLGGDTTDNKLIVDALNDISAKYGGDSDNKLIVDALNDIVDNYSGGGGDNYDIREITIVNNRERSEDVCTVAVIQKQGDFKRSYNTSIFGGLSKTVEVVAPQYSSSANNYKAQLLIIQTKSSFTDPVIDSTVATTFGHIVVDRYRYTIIETVPGSKDITLTIS